MTITIFGATGMVGKYVVAQALANGDTVKAFGRNVESLIDKDLHNENFEAIKGYVFDESNVYKAIKNIDAVISVLGGGFDGTDKTRSIGIKNIIAQMQKAKVNRIIALGGLGILNADEDTLILDTPGYPEMYKPVGREHLEAYQYLQHSILSWTFICPPNILDKDKTGNYITNANYPTTPNNNEIAAGDIADCMLQELVKNKFIKMRVGISRL